MINCWFDGSYCSIDNVRISPLDFGFIHGDATYDVMKSVNARPCFYDIHMKRFEENCNFYGFTYNDYSDIVNNLINDCPNSFVWFIKWRGTPPSGSPRDLSGPEHTLIYAKPYYGISDSPITLSINEDLPRSPGYQTHKNFSWIELTRAQRFAETDTAIVRSVEGYINEGPGFGICFVVDNIVVTPKTDVLNSVTIHVVEEMCKELAIGFERRDFKEYNQFSECFICSTSGGLTPVKSLNEHQFLSNNITEILRNHYEYKVAHNAS
mgnify:CR=1 FL=1